MTDSQLRPSGTVELECPGCRGRTWHDPLSETVSRAAAGTYTCGDCRTNPLIGFTCSACNRPGEKRHLEMSAELNAYWAHHCAECLAAGVPYHSFAEVVWCWSCADGAESPDGRCGSIATHAIERRPECGCPACWQTTYHACDAHRDALARFFRATSVTTLPKVAS